jgi:hypothetical protein
MDHNDHNLVISDEDISNPTSARSFNHTIGSQLSPKTDGKFLSTQELLGGSAYKADLQASNEKSVNNRYSELSPERSNEVRVDEPRSTPRYIHVTTTSGGLESEPIQG